MLHYPHFIFACTCISLAIKLYKKNHLFASLTTQLLWCHHPHRHHRIEHNGNCPKRSLMCNSSSRHRKTESRENGSSTLMKQILIKVTKETIGDYWPGDKQLAARQIPQTGLLSSSPLSGTSLSGSIRTLFSSGDGRGGRTSYRVGESADGY